MVGLADLGPKQVLVRGFRLLCSWDPPLFSTPKSGAVGAKERVGDQLGVLAGLGPAGGDAGAGEAARGEEGGHARQCALQSWGTW